MNNLPEEVTLFLIEDDDVDALFISRELEKNQIGNPLVRATDGMEAMEMINEGVVKPPFIILLDLQMPRMGGIEFLQRFQNDPGFQNSAIFVWTTSSNIADIEASYSNNIAGYIIKESSTEISGEIIKLLKNYKKTSFLTSQI